MPKVLAGLRVIEMGTFITGPAAAMYLADLGADVIKVERPGTRRPLPRLQRRALQPALPDLQPQQALDHSRYGGEGRSRRLPRADPGRRRVHPEFSPRRGGKTRRRRGGAARAQPAPRLLRDLRLRHERTEARPPRLRHGRPGRERFPAVADAARKSSRHRSGDRRCDDRHLRGARRARRTLRAAGDGQGPSRRRVDAGGDVPLQSRLLHALLFGRRDHGAAQPPQRVAVLRLRMRRRKMAGAPHVLPAEILGGARPGDRPAGHVRRSALRHPRGAHRAPGRHHRLHGADLQDRHARRVVRAPGGRRGAALARL